MSIPPTSDSETNELHPLELPAMQKPALAEEVAEIAATVAELRAGQVAERSRARLRPLEIILLTLLAASLILHALTITRLFGVRNTLRDQIDQLATSINEAKSSQLSYTVTIDQQVPINVDVPIQRSFSVPIDTEVRIQQTVEVPVETVLGSYTIPVPIDATIPVSTTVPIQFDQTLNIDTSVPIKLDVPIQIDLGSEQVSPVLDRLREKLIELRDSL